MSLNTPANWLLYGSMLTPYDTNDLTLRTSTEGKLILDTSNTNISGDMDISGNITFKNNKGIVLEGTTAPSTTSNTLYRVGNDIYWNGSALGGESSAQIASLDTSMASVETRLDAADVSLNDHIGKINTNTSSISTNTSSISTNLASITANKTAADASFVDHLTKINDNKTAADTSISNLQTTKLNLSGGTMTGTLNMGTQKITSTYTPSAGEDMTNKTYVDGKVSALVDGAPAMLDTLGELATAITDNSNVVTNLLTRIGTTDVSVNSLDTRTTTLENSASSNNTTITNLGNRVTSAEDDITANKSAADASFNDHIGKINTNTASISTNTGSISSNSMTISNNKSAADASFNDHLTKITNNKTAADASFNDHLTKITNNKAAADASFNDHLTKITNNKAAADASFNDHLTKITNNKAAADASFVYIEANYAPKDQPSITGGMTVTGGIDVTGNVSITGSFIPSADVTYDLGSSSKRFKDLYLSGNTINLGGTTLSSSGDSGSLKVGDGVEDKTVLYKEVFDPSYESAVSSINTNASNITSNKSAADASFVEHLGKINTNTSNITSNKSAADASFNDHLTKINTNTSNITSNKSAADASFNDHLGKINTNTSSISSNQTNITNNKSAADASFNDHLTKINTNTSSITSNKSAADASFVDLQTNKLNLSGGTMTGALNMGSQKITSTYTPSAGEDITNKTYVDGKVSALVDGAPAMLDTLGELATAITDNSNVVTNLLTRIGTTDVSVNSLDTRTTTLESSVSSNSTDISNKVSKSGDTMTGALVIDTSTNHYELQTTTNQYGGIFSVKTPSGTSFDEKIRIGDNYINTYNTIYANGNYVVNSSGNGDGIVFDNNNFHATKLHRDGNLNLLYGDLNISDLSGRITTNAANITSNQSAIDASFVDHLSKINTNTSNITSNKSAADASFVYIQDNYAPKNAPSITGGMNVTGDLDVTGHIIPSADITYDLGSSTKRFRDLYLSGNTINLGGTAISSTDDSLVVATAVRPQNTVFFKEDYDPSYSVTINQINDVSNTLFVNGQVNVYDVSFALQGGNNGHVAGFLNVNGFLYGANHSAYADTVYTLYPPFYDTNDNLITTYSGIIVSTGTVATIDLTKPVKFMDNPYGDTLTVTATSTGQTDNTYNATFAGNSSIQIKYKETIGSVTHANNTFDGLSNKYLPLSLSSNKLINLNENHLIFQLHNSSNNSLNILGDANFAEYEFLRMSAWQNRKHADGTLNPNFIISGNDSNYSGDMFFKLAKTGTNNGIPYTPNTRIRIDASGSITFYDHNGSTMLALTPGYNSSTSNFVSKTGDVMTGTLQIQNASDTNLNSYLDAHQLYINALNNSSTAAIHLASNNGVSATTSLLTTNGNFQIAHRGRTVLNSDWSNIYSEANTHTFRSYGTSSGNANIKFSSNTNGKVSRITMIPDNWNPDSYMVLGDYATYYGREIAFSYNDGILYRTSGGRHKFDNHVEISGNVYMNSTNILKIGSGNTSTFNAQLQIIQAPSGSSYLHDHTYISSYYQWQNNGINRHTDIGVEVNDYHTASIVANNDIMTFGVLRAVSDIRIKTNIVDASNSLELMRKIPLKRYNYRDPIAKGTASVRGWIAQEVREHMPEAITFEKDYIPNIMLPAEIVNNTIVTSEQFDVSNIDIKVLDASNEAFFIKLGNKIPVTTGTKYEFTFKEENFEFQGPCFIYGELVDDFHTIDKTKLHTLLYGAVSELDEQLNTEVKNLKSNIEELSDKSVNNDNRVIKDVQVIDDSSSLNIVKNIEPKKYKYVDVSKGEKVEYGFVAQEVANVLPEAVETVSHPLPTVLEDVQINGDIITFNKIVNLDLGNHILINNLNDFDYNGDPLMIKRKISDMKYQLDRPLTDKSGFCYGRYVNDFTKLSKDKLMPVLWSGTQQLIRENNEMKNRLATLEQQVAALLAK